MMAADRSYGMSHMSGAETEACAGRRSKALQQLALDLSYAPDHDIPAQHLIVCVLQHLPRDLAKTALDFVKGVACGHRGQML
jgi:hypothetical protein